MGEQNLLDVLDRKILFRLDLDARTAQKALAKNLHVSVQTLNYRIRRLSEQGVVKHFYSVINLGLLDYESFRIYFRFQNLTPDRENEFIRYLIKSPNIVWAARCRGHWDVVASVWAKNASEFAAVYHSIVDQFDDILLTKNICVIEKADHFNRTYLLPNPADKKSHVYAGSKQEIVLDALDESLLSLLSHDCRQSFLELSRKLSVSPETVANHVKQLEKSGVLMGYRLLFNLPKIGYLNNIIILKLHYLNQKRVQEFFNFCSQHKNVIFIMYTLGDHDVDLEVEVANQSELDGFITELRQKFSDIIRDLETLMIFDEPKFDYFPFEKIKKK